MTHDDDRYFDIAGLAGYSGLSVQTLRRYMKDPAHPLPHHRIHPTGKGRGRVLIRKVEFDTWVASFSVSSTTNDDDAEMDRAVAAAVKSIRGM